MTAPQTSDVPGAGEIRDGHVWVGDRWQRLPDAAARQAEISADGVPPLSEKMADADLVALLPTYLRDVERSIKVEKGRRYTPDDIERILDEISDRMDAGHAYECAIIRALSEAQELLDTAEAFALAEIDAEYERQGKRLPAEDLRRAKVVLRTQRLREQRRRLRVLADIAAARMKHLRVQMMAAQSIGANMRGARP